MNNEVGGTSFMSPFGICDFNVIANFLPSFRMPKKISGAWNVHTCFIFSEYRCGHKVY